MSFGGAKSLQNPGPEAPKSTSGGVLGWSWSVLRASWGYLGRPVALVGCVGSVLGASWGVLGASRSRFGGSWGSLACVLGCLGAFLTRLVAILGASWGVLGASCA